MDAVNEFADATEVYFKQRAFLEKFEGYRRSYLNEGPPPTRVVDIQLRHLFEDAYPTTSHYIQSVFEEAVTYAKNFDLPVPKIPASNILDIRQDVVAGMGDSFFLRLIYLQNLARNELNQLQERMLLPLPKILPDLKLLTASDIFHALRIEGSKTITLNDEDTPQPKKSFLPSLLAGSYNKASDRVIETGFVKDVKTPALVNGQHVKIVSVALQEAGTTKTKLVDIYIDGPLKDQIKIGDFIGARDLKKAKNPHHYMVPGALAMLVPASVDSFLKTAEPDFSHSPSSTREQVLVTKDTGEQEVEEGDVLTDENTGTIIFGRVLNWDERSRTITIKGHDNQTLTLRSQEPIENFKLEKNMIFLTPHIKLDDDGIYTVSSQKIHRLEAPYAGRLLFGLKKMSVSEPTSTLQNDAEAIERDFQKTEPAMP